jgi:hypothetical protein
LRNGTKCLKIQAHYSKGLTLIHDEEDFRKEIVFKHGCYGYETQTGFEPLMNWMKTKRGDYVPNCGNKVIYTEKYPFWLVT